MSRLKKSKKHCEITERDYKILRFLWKWKMVSTQALAKRFFPEVQAYSAYRRLLHLEADNYIESFVVNGRFHEAWGLKEKGFKYIKPYLGELKSTGFKSANPHHDYLASAFHLGEWLLHQPKNSQTFSEQQLKSYPEDLWPFWVPKSTLHRPDGYSIYQVDNTRSIIAFETELSLKASHRYESIFTFYTHQSAIDYVFWLIDSQSTLSALKKHFKKFQLSEWSKHQFLILAEFQKKGWRASFMEGKLEGKTPAYLLLHKSATILSQQRLACGTQALLDSRRRPMISKPYKASPQG